MDSIDTADPTQSTPGARATNAVDYTLCIVWNRDGGRAGEIAQLKGKHDFTFGRSGEPADPPRLVFVRQRPSILEDTPPIAEAALSRSQAIFRRRAGKILLEVAGKRATFVNGRPAVNGMSLKAGDLIYFDGQLLLMLLLRVRMIPAALRFTEERWGKFGEPNALGFVGETPVMWTLYEEIALAAAMSTHVLVLGQTGTGKELAARAIHALSSRAKGPFVSYSAAGVPETLAASIFSGSAKNYPNSGQPERAGLFGAAHGGTLFLDEIGELPHEAQAALLRALDFDGEHTRLGETAPRHSDFRLVAATNRPDALKADFRGRFRAKVELPSLDARREDIPLLVRHLITEGASRGNELATRWLTEQVKPRVIEKMMLRKYPGNIRELDEVLWRGLRNAEEILKGETIATTVDPKSLTVERVR